MDLEKIREQIQKILLSNSVRNNQDLIFTYIPELKDMVSFKHNHPEHHLDVWEHTLAVLDNLDDVDDIELKMAGLLHDVGKVHSFQDEEVRHFRGHPKVSKEISDTVLQKLGYEKEFIDSVGYFVLKHDTPIDPDHLDNSYEMVKRLLKLQYADAKAHKPDKVQKRLDFLNDISKKLELNKERENDERQ